MSSSAAVQPEASGDPRAVMVNDFSISVATVNGTGSQTANNTLIRAIMRMGIPVSGKNIFPSNIQGLPTWFHIRVSEAGWLARTPAANVVICLNRDTAEQDVADAAPGAAIIYDEPYRLSGKRDDVSFYPVPFGRLAKDCAPGNMRLRKLLTNMIYVGVACELLDVEVAQAEAALEKFFATKPKAVPLNRTAIAAGVNYAKEHFADKPALRVERRDLTEGKILIDGNSAAALGAVMGGCTVLGWYPITPSSSVAETFQDLVEKYRRDEDGKATFAVVQAEDELAAAGMVFGAGWAGARAMTTTSGPGISLMSEFIGLGYYAEIPGVFVDVQRTGPSTGLPTRTMQGDLLLCAYNSQGDSKHPMLLPGTVQECYELMVQAFDLAEQFQTPVFFVSDLDLGMNNWLADPFPYPDEPMDRGKVLDKAALLEMGVENWGRYKDVDGDGVPYRTLPGTELDGAAFFTRGSGHDEHAKYTESGEVYQRNMDRLAAKFESLRTAMPAPALDLADGGSRVGLIAFGTTHWAVLEARVRLRENHDVVFDYMRLKAYPFSDEVHAFFDAHDYVYVVEQNRDAQMATLLQNEMPDVTPKIRSVLHYDGMPIDALAVTNGIADRENA